MMFRPMALMLCVLLINACATHTPLHGGDQLLVVIDHQPQSAFLGDPSHPYRRHSTYQLNPALDRTLNRLAAQYQLKRQSGWPIGALGAYCEVFSAPAGASVAALVTTLDADPAVRFAQPMGVFEVMTSTTDRKSSYNDPYVNMQHALGTMRVEDAHGWTRGSDVQIAVIDTGITQSHADLRNQVVRRRSFVPAGFAGVESGHGTAVAGVIASVANNHSGIVGVAPEAYLLDLQACWTQENRSQRATCNSLSLARALSDAIESGADVINLSLAGPEDKLLKRLIRRAFAAGAVLVAAAGPANSSALQFPANMAEVLAADLSAHAKQKTVFAPGQEILTTTPQGYDFVSGSSISAAHVSGLVALLRSYLPRLNATEVNQLFLRVGTGPDSLDACTVLSAGSGSAVCAGPETASLKNP